MNGDDGTERPEYHAVDEVDGKDMGKDYEKRFDGEDCLCDGREFDQDLKADGENEPVETGEEVIRIPRVGRLSNG